MTAIQKMTDHQLIFENILKVRVCSSGTWDEALEWLRRKHPAGTSNNWQKDKQTHSLPVRCADNPERSHYMFVC